MTNASAIGFTSAPAGTWDRAVPVEGQIPAWLRGRFIHTGPAQFEVGRDRFRHWFDGLALLTCVEIEGGRARFRSRPLRTEARRRDTAEGRIAVGEFGTPPSRGLWQRLAERLRPPNGTDNANVNVFALDGVIVAATETPRRIVFDPRTLETRGELELHDELGGQVETAHPQFDPVTGVTYSYATRYGLRSTVELLALSPGASGRHRVAQLDADRPAYVHSFGMSRDHLVFVEPPLRAHPLAMRFSGKAYHERHRWRPDEGTRIRVVAKADGKVVADVRVPPFFFFHEVNTIDLGDCIALDLVTYPDASIVRDLTLDRLRSDSPPQAVGRLERLTIPLTGDAFDVERLSETPIELPRIDPRRRTQRLRFVYGVSSDDPHTFFDRIVRIDLDGGRGRVFARDGWFPGEPVFVPAPGSEREDDGVVLALVVDAERERARMLVLRAEDLELHASILLPHHIPFHFHGDFFPLS